MRRAAGYREERQEGPPLPNLPGMNMSATLNPKPKAQTLRYRNGYPIVEDADPMDPLNRAYKWGGRVQDIGPVPPFALHEEAPDAPRRREPFMEPGSSTRPGKVPNWIAYTGKVLRFLGFFTEQVPNSPVETWRVRRIQLRYYLESDQVEIMELWEQNNGMPQGILLKRHCAVKADGTPLRWPDLRIGPDTPLVLYSRAYYLNSADAYTREFYAEHMQDQAPDEPIPDGPYDIHKKYLDALKARAMFPEVQRATTTVPGFARETDGQDDWADVPRPSPRGPAAVFEALPYKPLPEEELRDGAVLRFMCAWDNTAVTFGEVLAFALHYHVRDGTVEIREVNQRNSGRDPFPLLLSRQRLPKTVPPVMGRPLSPRSRRLQNIQYYTWRDLWLGTTVNCFGRPLLVYDCDESTRAWLREHVPGMDEERLQRVEVDFDPNGPKRPPLSIPPHTSGIGSEEDSLQNVLHLIPRPPPKPYADYLENWNKVLRFEACLVPVPPKARGEVPQRVERHDQERRFIVSFFLLDRTLSIWETRQPNSGRDQGTFLERTRVRNPVTAQNFTETDMQVGAILEIYGRGFQLLDADNYTLSYMERECARFPAADFDRVLHKLRAWLEAYPDQLPDRLRGDLLVADRNGSGYVSKHTLYSVLSALGGGVSPQEVSTLVRRLGADRQGLLIPQLLVALGMEPPPEEPEQPLEGEHHGEGQEDGASSSGRQQPDVPFPNPEAEHLRRVAWAPHPAGPLGRPATAAAPPPVPASSAGGDTGYQGLGPMPGYPRVARTPTPQVHFFDQENSSGGAQGQRLYWQGKGAGEGIPAGSTDVQRVRDTPERRAWEAAVNGNSWKPTATGVRQPPTMWQTTYTSIGGVGNPNSFRRQL